MPQDLQEIGKCENCGPQRGPFEFEHGPRCPSCGTVLLATWEVPGRESIMSDTTAADTIDGGVR